MNPYRLTGTVELRNFESLEIIPEAKKKLKKARKEFSNLQEIFKRKVATFKLLLNI